MGCWKSQQRNTELTDMNLVLKRMIDLGRKSAFSDFLRKNPGVDIDDEFLLSDTLRLSPLSYSVFIGRVDMFQFLYGSIEERITKMEELLNKQGFRSMDIICIQGHLNILKIYLPLYISVILERPKYVTSEPDETLNLHSDPTPITIEFYEYTPIQYACINCHINIIQYLNDYFQSNPSSFLFDINYQDEIEGQNCAFISCKLGNYKLMKFLYENCKADFHMRNKRDENTIQVLVAASKRKYSHNFYVCLKYLLEVIKVDPTYRYEEVVLILNNYKLLEIYCKSLAFYNIFPNKDQLEMINRIQVYSEESECYDFEYKSREKSTISVVSSIRPITNSTQNQISF